MGKRWDRQGYIFSDTPSYALSRKLRENVHRQKLLGFIPQILEDQMLTSDRPTPADLRAEMARKRVRIYHVTAQVGVSPTKIGNMLRESEPMTDKVRNGLAAALEAIEEKPPVYP
jgi:hypothetical protein